MASASLSSQLQVIKTNLNVSTDPEPGRRRPLTRPSILYDAKSAADIDLDTIHSIALEGLEALITKEERFAKYKSDLFSHQSKEMDRELVGVDENMRIDASIKSYLRLLSGYLESHSAVKTLEYLIRRYRIHVYNVEELILCALPFHDTHVFVQIVQLIDMGNSRWKFLDGVKVSGARMPREVIVQQCIRDMGVLEAICNYAMPVKKIQPSMYVTGFCTAVIFELLGLVNIDSDIVTRILPYVNSGLQAGAKGLNQKAGALMIVTILAQKAALAHNVVKSLMHLVAELARADAKETTDFQWLRMSFMALINIVQLQSVEIIPKKTMDILNNIRDIWRILLGLSKEFNIDKFFTVILDSLIEHSVSDELCHRSLLSMIETFPMKGHINCILSKFLTLPMKAHIGKLDVVSSETGSKIERILASVWEKYPNELRQAAFSFLKDAQMHAKKVTSSYEILCKMIAPTHDNLKFLFAMEHSEAGIRRSAIQALDAAEVLREKAAGSTRFEAVQDAIQRRLYDADLNVVLAVLQLENLTEMLNSSYLVEAIRHSLQKCVDILLSGSSTKVPRLLQHVIKSYKNQEEYTTTLATSVFPLILIRPKTQRLNLEGLELAKELNWPLFENLIACPESEKNLEIGQLSSINMRNIDILADAFSSRPEEYIPWFINCCKAHDLSKTLFFMVLLQSLKLLKMDSVRLSEFIDALLPILRSEWGKLGSTVFCREQSNKSILDGDCKRILEELIDTNVRDLNTHVLACLFLKLFEALIATLALGESLDMEGKWVSTLQDLFVFLASDATDIFSKHLEYLCTKSKISLTPVMVKFFTEGGVPSSVQVKSLQLFTNQCTKSHGGLAIKLLEEFPSTLIPLSSDNQEVRLAAMSCIEELSALWSRVDIVGNNGVRLHFLGELLDSLVQQKKMIVSDNNVLTSFFTSLLGSSSYNLLVQQTIGKRFAEATKSEILDFLLVYALRKRLSAHAKLKILTVVRALGSTILFVDGVTSLLEDLLERRYQYHSANGKLGAELSQSEVEILCLLLESCTRLSPSREGQSLEDLKPEDFILKALVVNDIEDSAVQEPCLTVLRNLSSLFYGKMKTEAQERIIRKLLILFRSTNGDIQNAAKDALLRIDVNCSIIGRIIDTILDNKPCSAGVQHEKKRKKSVKSQNQYNDPTQDMENTLSFLTAFLDMLLMKKNIDNRISLGGPLFKLLRLIFTNGDWIFKASNQENASMASSSSPPVVSDAIAYTQQTLLLVLENISSSVLNDIPPKDALGDFDLQLLVSCAQSSKETVTRNHVFSLITTLAKIIPDKVLDHILDILTVIGDSTVTQWDSYSQRVFEDLVSTIVPYWLSKTGNIDQVIQIFVNILPKVAGHRRLSIITHILRTLGEAESLGSMLFFLCQSLISRNNLFSLYVNEPSLDDLAFVIHKQWEFEFAVQLLEQYSCTIWLRSLIIVLQKIGESDLCAETYMEMLVAMQFVPDKLRDPEISYKLDSGDDLDYLQGLIGNLMEKAVTHLRLIDSKKKNVSFPAGIKNELKEYVRSVIKAITKGLLPAAYFEVIMKLTDHKDRHVRKKALGLLCETVKEFGIHTKIEKKGALSSRRNSWVHLDEISLKSLEKLCSKILKLLDAPDDDAGTTLQLAAVSAIDVLANRFPSNDRVFGMCLGSVCKRICSDNFALSCHCLRATGALVTALGTRALPELPNIMKYMIAKGREFSSMAVETERTIASTNSSSKPADSLFMSLLITLEAIVSKLGGFLNPYLSDILRLVMLHPSSLSTSEQKSMSKADAVRKLIVDKIPVRLLIPPLLEVYSDAVTCGESSLSTVFEMLGNLAGSMDRSSAALYHAKVFDFCLLALDLRRQSPPSIRNIHVVEQNVIEAVVTLSMRLTDPMFRPLFIKTIEWSGINAEDDENIPGKVNRAISFFSFVDKIAGKSRYLFIPYFKYLLDGIVRGLADAEDSKTGLTRKKKKAKNSNTTEDKDNALSLQQWHLRAQILSSLHKCFLYDTESPKVLDKLSFQALLKPIVSQLVVDPPASIENDLNVPSVSEVDDILVECIGQMAVASDSDVFCKQLNHEVLMCTRSEKVRARILGLRITRKLLEKLKEEYGHLLPETMPFLSELLEDAELSVKTLAQEIFKEIEVICNESLRDYL